MGMSEFGFRAGVELCKADNYGKPRNLPHKAVHGKKDGKDTYFCCWCGMELVGHQPGNDGEVSAPQLESSQDNFGNKRF